MFVLTIAILSLPLVNNETVFFEADGVKITWYLLSCKLLLVKLSCLKQKRNSFTLPILSFSLKLW